MRRGIRNWGIRKRVMVIALLPAALIALLLTAYLIHAQVDALERAAERRGHALSQHLATVAAQALAADQQTLARLATAVLGEPDVVEVQVLDAAGRALLELQSEAPDPSTDLVFRTPIGNATAAPLGWAEVHLSRRFIQRNKQTVVASSVVIALLGLALSAFFARRLGRDVIDPVLQLTHAVRAIGAGRFDTRVHTASSGELKSLEHGINQMGAALEEMQLGMQARVDRATEDLRHTLEQLEERNRMLEAARAQAREGERIKSEFLANISHEIRTPMNAITGFTNLLLKTPLDREQHDYACTVRDSANSLLTVINDILDFSRIAAGKLELDHAPFDLRQVVDGALSITAPAAYDKHLDLVLLFYTDVPELLVGDAVRIRQVLMNLIGNAIKFTQRGRVVVRVMIEEQTSDGVKLRISVQDTGVGLRAADQERLFAAFGQADSSASRAVGGVGIGLVICKQLAERMGGAIGMESTPGHGSTFWFTLRAELQTDAAPEAGPPQPFAGIRALLYERDELQSSGLTAQLQAWGMQVTPLSDCSELKARLTGGAANGHRPQLAFLGLQPEELEEPEIAELLQRTAGDHRCAVIVLMSTVNRRLLDEATAAGAAFALPKVAPRDELRAVVTQALNAARATHSPRHDWSSADAGRAAPMLGAIRVLVVDDNLINRKLMCTLYEKAGATVDAAASGEQALRLFTAASYDLVFMDIQMPGMNGIDTAERMRALERETRRTPVIAVTAAALRGERERLIRAGFDDCLIKPVHESELWEMAHRWLEPHQLDGCGPWTEHVRVAVSEPEPKAPYAPRPRTDRSRAIRIAGGNEQLANELFGMLLAELPDMRRRLNDAFEAGQLDSLESEAHKLHGAASYCALEPLRAAAALVERAAKHGEDDLGQHLDALNRDIDRLLAEHTDPAAG